MKRDENKIKNEIQALQNAANCSVPCAEVKEVFNNDLRKPSKYVLSRLGTAISPPLDYLTLNAFILGYGRGFDYAEKQEKETAPHKR